MALRLKKMETNQNILFVDDDIRLLSGLKRALHHETEVGLYFATESSNAFEIMQKNKIDVVVSGFKAKDMSGSEILEKVKESNPGSVRMMFAGFENDSEIKQQSSDLVHRHISRPCSSLNIIDMIKSVSRKWADVPKEFRVVAADMPHLPFLPETIEYVRSSRGLDLNDKALVQLLARDLGFVSWVLRNSDEKIYDLNCSGTNDFIIKVCDIYGFLHNGYLIDGCVRCYEEPLLLSLQRRVYYHGSLTGEYASGIAGDILGEDSCGSRSLLAGMLHDAGKLVIAQKHAQQYQLLDRSSRSVSDRLQQENNDFGASHNKVGAMLLDLWGIPEVIVDAVLNHHETDCLEGRCDLLTIVKKANWMAHGKTDGNVPLKDYELKNTN